MIIPVISLITFGMIIGWIIYILRSSWNARISIPLLVMGFFYAVWILSNVGMSLTTNDEMRWIFLRVSGIGWVFLPFAALFFTIQITDLLKKLTRRILYIFGTAVAVIIALFSVFKPEYFVTRFERTALGLGIIKSDISVVFFLYWLFTAGCSLIISFLLWKWYLSSQSKMRKKQSAILLSSALFSFLTSLVFDMLLPLAGLTLPSIAPLMLVFWFFGILQFFLEGSPYHDNLQLSVSEIMTHMRELSFVISTDGTVLLMNAAARNLLGYDRSDMGHIHIRTISPEIRLPKGDMKIDQSINLKNTKGYDVPVSISISNRYNQYGDNIGFFLHATPVIEKNQNDGDFETKLKVYATEKSVALKAIMEYFDEAILFVGRDGRIRPEYSPFCKNLFNMQELSGRSFADLAFSGLDMKEQNALKSILESVFTEERLWRLEALMPMLPAHLIIDHNVWNIEYRLLNTSKSGLDRIMMVQLRSTNVVKQVVTHDVQENDHMKMVVTVVNKKSSFYDLMQEYNLFFKMSISSFMQLARTPREILYELYRNVHTFKSRFARLNMMTTRDHLNIFEDTLQPMLEKEVTPLSIRSIYADIVSDAWVKSDIDVITRILGNEFLTRQDLIEVNRTLLDSIAHEMEQLTRGPECIRLTTRFREMYCVRILAELREYGEYIRKLGLERMNCEPEYIVQGYDLLVDSKTYRHFLQSMVHIFNNIIGHGLESADERIANGKPPKARIECHVQKRQDRLLIEIADDGRGIDILRIRDGLRSRGLQDEADHKTEQEILHMIFEPGFSTLMTADEISGRGIGLFAVSQAVKQLGGIIEVFSKPGLYTRFEFDLPLVRMSESEQT